MGRRIARLAVWTVLAFCCVSPTLAATAVDDIHVDLNPLIDAAARSKERFAVNIPHFVSSSTKGSWSRRGSMST
jgi:hypothetical protein